jgi:hypothetical protein
VHAFDATPRSVSVLALYRVVVNILPAYLIAQTAITQRAKDIASLRVRRTIDEGVGFGPVPDDLKGEFEAIVTGFQEVVSKTESHENLARGNRGWKELMLDSSPRIRGGVEAILVTQITMAWTAFESLATDLWIEAVNARPISLGYKALIAPPSRQDRPERIHPTTSITDEKHSIDSIRIDVLRRHRFNLENKIGAVVWSSRKFNFNRLNGIQYAYSLMFGEGAKSVFKKYDRMRIAEAVRNLLVHKGGVVDEQFRDRVKKDSSLSKLNENDRLPIDGTLALDLTDTSVRCGIDLIEMVDTWLSDNSE